MKLIQIYKSLIVSRTSFPDVITPNNKNVFRIKQKITNENLRSAMGLVRSTPISTILAESASFPAEIENTLNSTKYIAKQIYLNSQIGKNIKENNITGKLSEIYNNNTFLENIGSRRNAENITTVKNLKIELDLIKNTNTSIETITANFSEILKKYEDCCIIFTDGSLSGNEGGIGIFMLYPETKTKIRLINNASIKTIETIAIKEAINRIPDNTKNTVIFTDSKSCCMSLLNTLEGKSKKFYELEIISRTQQSKENFVTICWIPGHTGIAGNEVADELAKQAITSHDILLNNNITIEDAYQTIFNNCRNEWISRYNTITRDKGKYNKMINTTPPKKIWFRHSTLNASEIKTINRLRSGHANNKKFKHLMGLEEDNTCNEVEDNQHIIEKCSKYHNIRTKYKDLENANLINILKENNQSKYKSICNFLKEIEYPL